MFPKRVVFSVLFLFSNFLLTKSDDVCTNTLISAKTATDLGLVDGKCIAMTVSSYSGNSNLCSSIGKGVTYEQLSIDNQDENEAVKEALDENDVSNAYINLKENDSGWYWANGDTSTYGNWKNPPATPAPSVLTTLIPQRSTLAPSEQRRSTAVVVAVDASIFSTNDLTFAQVDFIRSLSHYIGDRGPAEFAFFAYGCTQISPYTNQYPTFVNSFVDTDNMIQQLSDKINQNCTKTNYLDFKTMFRDQTLYYNRYSFSVRPFKSQYLSMIYFSSSTDSNNVRNSSALYPMANSNVITVNVGDASIDVSPFSIPARKNGLRVRTAQEILGLVPTIDAIIFGTTASVAESEYQRYKYAADSNIDTADKATDCAYMNTTDGKWYSDGNCDTKRPLLCQYVMPTPAPPPTLNPSVAWADPCYQEETNFTAFSSLQNAKCYRISTSKKQFAEAEDTCITDHPLFLHSPKLTSIQTKSEEEKVTTLAANLKNEGMFWFGLKRDVQNASNWVFVNGDPYDPTVHSNWQEGYPRDADRCDCVALVLNTNSWVNTDCNKSLYSICAYRFNSTV